MNTTININNTTSPEFKSLIKQKLNEGTMKVTFIKQNGSRRVMNCTTSPKVTPEVSSPRRNADTMTVFDVDAKDWRSFRWDRITNVEPVAAY